MDFSDCEHNELVLTGSALHRGLTYRDLVRAAADGRLVRLRRGCYVRAEVWGPADGRERHVLRMRAAAALAINPVIFSGASAAAIWKVPLDEFPLDVTVIDSWRGGGRSEAGVRRTSRGATSADIVQREGFACTTIARTVLDVTRRLRFAEAVPVLDWVLSPRNAAPITHAELIAEAIRMRCTAAHLRAVFFATPLSGSIGESGARAVIRELGFPAPQLQRCFVDGAGDIFTDFYWEGFDVAGEFDGKSKYTRDEYTKGDPGEVVWKEKKREDRLRRQVRTVVRILTYEVKRPALLAARLLEAGIRRG